MNTAASSASDGKLESKLAFSDSGKTESGATADSARNRDDKLVDFEQRWTECSQLRELIAEYVSSRQTFVVVMVVSRCNGECPLDRMWLCSASIRSASDFCGERRVVRQFSASRSTLDSSATLPRLGTACSRQARTKTVDLSRRWIKGKWEQCAACCAARCSIAANRVMNRLSSVSQAVQASALLSLLDAAAVVVATHSLEFLTFSEMSQASLENICDEVKRSLCLFT